MGKLKSAFVNHSADIVAAIMQGRRNDKYGNMKFIADVKDKEYDFIRKMFKRIGYPEFAKGL